MLTNTKGLLLLNPYISNGCAPLQIKKIHQGRDFFFFKQQEAQVGIPDLVQRLNYACSCSHLKKVGAGGFNSLACRVSFLSRPRGSWASSVNAPRGSVSRETGTAVVVSSGWSLEVYQVYFCCVFPPWGSPHAFPGFKEGSLYCAEWEEHQRI